MRLLSLLGILGGILAAAPPSNAVVITDLSGTTSSPRPFTVSRFFAAGEIPNYARARLNGTLLTSQCDVKTRWPDGSVQHALISFLVAIDAHSSLSVDFVDAADGNNNGAWTEREMLNFAWGARIEASAGGLTQPADARAMLASRSWRYWLEGPICSQVIVEGSRESPASAFAFDFGWQREGSHWVQASDAAYKSLHPIFVLTFYRGWAGVKVEYILENTWTTKLQDQEYSLTLYEGNLRGRPVYEKESFAHLAKTRWRKVFWQGDAPPAASIDYGLPYLIYSRVLPNYDLSKVVPAEAISQEVAAFRQTDQGDLDGKGQWQPYFPATGGRPDIGLFPRWSVRYLYTFDPELYEVLLSNGAVSGYIPIHIREALAGRSYNYLGSADAFARPLSIDARPTVRTTSQSQDTQPVDLIRPVGPVSSGKWTVDLAHQPSMVFIPYLITGDWYFLEELYFWAAHNVAAGNPGTNLGYHRHADWGFLNDDQQIRGVAWGLRNLAHAALAGPAGSPEKAYFQQKLYTNIAVREGKHDITDGGFYSPCGSEISPWCWGRNTAAGGKRNPLQFLTEGNTAETDGLDMGQIYAGASPWMFNFWHLVLGHLSELGFPVRRLQETTARNLLHQLLDADYNPFLVANYRIPVRQQPGLRFLDTWQAVKAGYKDASAGEFSSKDSNDIEHGYPHIARAAASFLPGMSDGALTGAGAWEWIDAHVGGQELLHGNPKWALTPRAVSDEPSMQMTRRWERLRQVQRARRSKRRR